jgi:hypothetical protein
LAKRLVRLEERLTPVDYARNPRVRYQHREATESGDIDVPADSRCGWIFIRDRQARRIAGRLIRHDLEKFIGSFPAERV